MNNSAEKGLLSTRWHYVWQPLLAIIFISNLLMVLYHFATSTILWAVGAGSLSSSCFIVFAMPSSVTAKPINIIATYLIGLFIGFGFHSTAFFFTALRGGFLDSQHFIIIGLLAALAVGIMLLISAWLGCLHPPAAGMTLVMTLDIKDYNTVIIVLSAVILLTFLRWMLDDCLQDL